MKIRAYLFLMAAGILIPVVLFSGLALTMLQDAEKEAALGGLNQTANGVALLVERELYSAVAGLQVLAGSPSLAARDFKAYDEQARRTNRSDTDWHVLLDENGQQLVNTWAPFGRPLPKGMDAGRVRELAAAGKTVFSDIERGALTRKLITAVNMPVTMADGRSYILRHTFSAEHFARLVHGTRVPPGWLVAIVDGKGNFIARNMDGERRVGTPARPELVAAMRARPSGNIRHLTLENAEAIDVFTHPSLSGWAVAVAAPVSMIERSARRASSVAALGLFAAILCALALSAFLGRQHVRSIARAVKAATDLGNGLPPERLASRVVEVNELHAALHAAGDQLLQAQDYRKHAESERQALLEGEQRARLMAEQQNNAKDQFLAMLGHELRNPLAPISTAAQLLKLQSADPNRVRYASDVISRQVDHMNSLLGDMLDVSRVTRGLVSLSLEQVDLKAVLDRAVEQTHSLVVIKRHSLKVHVPDGPLCLRGDKTRLIQIVANLLNNSAKYTPPGGQIELSVTAGAGDVTIVVRDNGEGIAASLLPRVFELFAQGERAPDRSQGGLGLGLALVRSLVQLHGGAVEAFSAGPGQGSAFTVTLPRGEPARQAPAAAASLSAGRALGVMIVDDNVDGAISLSLFLEEAGGHRVGTYYDAGAALASAAAEAPDVFILDIGLPDITGYELARRLRAMPRFADAVFIALTGYGQPQDRKQAREAGFDHHVAKPADPKYILGLLDRIACQG